MKKYWKVITLVLFSVIIISGFYVQKALASTTSPEYMIETRSGDTSYIENIVLSGNVNNEEDMYWDYVQISTEGTKASEDFSFNEQLDYIYNYSPEIQKMYHEYPGFLRSKSMSANLYYEDEAAIVFVDTYIEDYQLPYEQMEIALLDKKSNEETQIMIDIPEYEKYDDLYIENVQKSGEEVMIFTVNYFNDQQYAELHAYRVDVATETVIEDQIIQPAAGEVGVDYSSILLNTYTGPRSSKAEHYMIYESSLKDEQDVDTDEILLSAYDTASGNLKELIIPSELKGLPLYPAMTVHESSIYYTNAVENGFEISRFDIEANKVAETQFVSLPSEVMTNFTSQTYYEGEAFSTYIDENIIYYVSASKENSGKDIAIVVADFNTGKVLYDGKIIDAPEMNESFKDNLLSIDWIYFN
ncbi:hypothetical protein JTF06_11065 [Desemzia sp. RIT804]|uniref:hypothetical protein n=1 Tax=Desemzia sp. RIT 804 TaxID=2810209 RepID=UPI0019507C02|nr:hypothetical protein [Desemzia sp. RIT 804]MBM6615430.1 hypothetical protein [Desemzia sp. RIT 804]